MKRRLTALLLLLLLLTGCGGRSGTGEAQAPVRSMELHYAEQFTVDYYADGSALLTIAGEDRFLVLPPGMEPPDHHRDATVIRQGAGPIYLAASSAMDLVLQLDALPQVRFTSTAAANWSLPEVREALEQETLLYAGKYSAPDFELLLSEHTALAVESTMIYHSPEVREKLEALGIPVLVERSSYEPHPLGRVEWIKVYGLLTGREQEAEAFFRDQERLLSGLSGAEPTGRTAAFFYVSSSGAAVVRKSGDYIAKMIAMAGGEYLPRDLGDGDNALSTVNMQMESFYAGAREADVLIYNSAIAGELRTREDLLALSPVLSDFRAADTGALWCTEQNVFQQSSAFAGMIAELHEILAGTAEDEMQFFHRLK